ncbi:MAG: mechanosensitive ion channel family protein [Bacteroidia bacterium]|nr:mechanosensitive ion channel family protein [Bacteroidia bacterium]MCX7652016.1 mechanosensitive ion channel family protein [Bacteroidia bacterium]MDW8416313.1 mechanosensitive ion channel family protein [Bacteroidia bacterium]
MRWWRTLWESEWQGILLGHWVVAIAILVIGFFIGRLIARGLSRVFHIALGKIREDISQKELHALMRPAWLFPLFLIALYGAASIVRFLHLPEPYISWVKRIFEALALLAIGLLGSRLLAVVQTILAAQYQKSGETYKLQLVHPLFTIGRIVLFLLIGFLMLEHTLKLNVAPFLTTLGLGGVAVALAAQETLQHFIGALAIFADKPFQIGDIVRLDASTAGTIEKIGLRSTQIRTFDNHLLIIPNKRLAESPLENISRTGERRVLFRIGVLYNTPIEVLDKLFEELKTALNELPFLARPAAVYLTNFLDSSMEVTIITFVRMDYEDSSGTAPLPIFYFQDKIAHTILHTIRRYEPHTSFAFPTRILHVASLPQAYAALSKAPSDGQ